jgi:hypothetical protein
MVTGELSYYDTMKVYWVMEVKLHIVNIGIRERWMVRCILVRFCSRCPWNRGLNSFRVWNWCQVGWSLLMLGIEHLTVQPTLSHFCSYKCEAVCVLINYSDSLCGGFESLPRNWIYWHFTVVLFTTPFCILSSLLFSYHHFVIELLAA